MSSEFLADKDFKMLSAIVREETGNHISEKNLPMLESRMRAHLSSLGLMSMDQYWDYFKANTNQERELLKGLMTTHYTFFFREFTHFQTLGDWIDKNITFLKDRFQKSGVPLKVWSAACSRGQEVYSLAMFLNVHLFKPYNVPFKIVGSDVDAESVSYAKNGVYPIKEVNTIPHIYLNGHWKKGSGPVSDFAAVHPSLKIHTDFTVLTLMDKASLISLGLFDVIFCRNVFIYFTQKDVQAIALSLAERLESNGILMSGLSEPLRFPEFPLTMIGATTYQKKVSGDVILLADPTPKMIVEQPSKPAANTESPTQTKYKVLCVDDSPSIQMIIKKIFSNDPNCESVDLANNGQEAREKLDKGQYHLITLDIHMPIVNGIEFLEKLYNRREDPPVLMISSVQRTDVELATKSLSLGAFDYVEKPAMNNLDKSTQEILTKARIALRSPQVVGQLKTSDFDEAISHKIVVPDASQCLRIVLAGSKSREALKQIIIAQKAEARSPALVIISVEDMSELETNLLNWTERQIVNLKVSVPALKPNVVYLLNEHYFPVLEKHLRLKRVSLQVLDITAVKSEHWKDLSQCQLLVDESLIQELDEIKKRIRLNISEVTPSTSFCSLSLEYYANLRKAAA